MKRITVISKRLSDGSFCSSSKGFEPIAAENVDEALEVLEHRHVNLAVLDIMLQGTDGYEFAKMLRDSGRDIPILIVTALEDIEHKKKGVKKEKFFLNKEKIKRND